MENERRVLFLDGIEEHGRDLLHVACERDFEGIVAKWARGRYQTGTPHVKAED